jgi:hypothetical protein
MGCKKLLYASSGLALGFESKHIFRQFLIAKRQGRLCRDVIAARVPLTMTVIRID